MKEKIVEYTVVEIENNIDRFEKLVNKFIHDGYEPHGSMQVFALHENSYRFYQPMILKAIVEH